MEPKIVARDEFMIAGTEYIGKNENGEISRMWGEEFLPRVQEIKNAVNPCVFYGLCSTIENSVNGEWSYIAGVEVNNIDSIPPGMVGRVIPAATYAVFTHTGPLTTLHNTFENIHQIWLPDSGYEKAADYDFEYYDERFKHMAEDSELDIWVPVKSKE